MEPENSSPPFEPSLLPASQKKKLRSQAQRLRPIIMVGKQGLTKQVIDELDTALLRDHLVKVRFHGGRNEIQAFCREIPEATQSFFVGSVGKTATFYR